MELPDVASIEVARLGVGDVVVVTAEGCLSRDTITLMEERLMPLFPNNKILVLESGITMKVMRQADV